jgi:tetratricopeptide (TPR) repeat protein
MRRIIICTFIVALTASACATTASKNIPEKDSLDNQPEMAVQSDWAEARIQHGIKLLKNNDIQGALAEFKQACDLGNRLGCEWYDRYKEKGPAPTVIERNPEREKELLEKVAQYEEAIKPNPQDTAAQNQLYAAHSLLAELYYKQNQYNEALPYLNASIEWFKENSWELHARGIILNNMGDKQASLRDWKRACDLGYIDSCIMYNAHK